MKSSSPSEGQEISKEELISDEMLIEALAKLHKEAIGIAVGTVWGFTIFFATLFLLAKGGENIGQNLALLGNYLIGYEVTVKGAFVGLVEGFVCGFTFGWMLAFVRNLVIAIHVYAVKVREDFSTVNEFFDSL